MNLLIVDDEFYIVQGIAGSLDRAALGIDQVFQAYSMKQAQAILKKETVDILLTDIAMPRGSGLDLVAWMHEEGLSPVTIFLTGHADFEYARKAIELKVLRYTLKPVEADELNRVLADAVAEARQLQVSADAEKLASAWNEAAAARQTYFWQSIFSGTILSDEASLKEAIVRFDLEDFLTADSSFYIALVQMNRTGDVPEPEDLADSFGMLFPAAERPAVVRQTPRTLMLVFCETAFPDFDTFSRRMNELRDRLSSLRPSHRFGIFYTTLRPLAEATETCELLSAVSSATFVRRNFCFPVLNSESLNDSAVSDLPISAYPVAQWADQLTALRKDDVLFSIAHQFSGERGYGSRSILIALYYAVFYACSLALKNHDLPLEDLYASLAGHDLSRFTESFDAFQGVALELVSCTEDLLQQGQKPQTLTEQVRSFVIANIASPDLNRDAVAEAIHMNADYLSYAFHKESGMTLNAFITNERISLAKKLLATTTDNMQSIADAAGFSNSSYFSKRFKKITGLTPQQYRDGETGDN